MHQSFRPVRCQLDRGSLIWQLKPDVELFKLQYEVKMFVGSEGYACIQSFISRAINIPVILTEKLHFY